MMTKSFIVKLSREIGYFAESISDSFTTRNYLHIVEEEYIDYVNNMYDEDFHNGFRRILGVRAVLSDKKVVPHPCNSLLPGLDQILDKLEIIIDNLDSYSPIMALFKGHCSSKISPYLTSLFNSLNNEGDSIRAAMTRFDRYLGDNINASMVIDAVYEYGRLSGLIDYYNMKERINGCSIKRKILS